MAADLQARTALFDEVLRRFASGVRAAQLYAPSHPLLARNVDGLLAALAALHADMPSVPIGIVGSELVVSDTPMPRTSAGLTELITRLREHRIERIAFERGVTAAEVVAFVRAVAGLQAKGGEPSALQSAHIRVGRLTADDRRSGGVASDMAAIRQLYAGAVASAEVVWESAAADGTADMPAAAETIEGLADAVTHNRTALMALTAMRSYDNYTFTHMVNVSILTMGQARALGLDGRLLREFGLAGLMHDIGKVRTPKEILNKPDRLTDEEFAVMRRHTVEGAEILRRTREMPALAPIVAFEHHLRPDGTGYPEGVTRDALNLATTLCRISDLYDAMRSRRVYQQASPTERILAAFRNERSLDQHLVRRFVQLLGIYPPGNLVRLSTGEIAVVVRVHAPDPARPQVRVLYDAAGTRLEVPYERNLFEAAAGAPPASVVEPIDPAVIGIDPLEYLTA